jgi:hypothetical protein
LVGLCCSANAGKELDAKAWGARIKSLKGNAKQPRPSPASRRKQSWATGWLASGAFLSSAVSARPAAGAAAAMPGSGSATSVVSWRSARATAAELRPGLGALDGGA